MPLELQEVLLLSMLGVGHVKVPRACIPPEQQPCHLALLLGVREHLQQAVCPPVLLPAALDSNFRDAQHLVVLDGLLGQVHQHPREHVDSVATETPRFQA